MTRFSLLVVLLLLTATTTLRAEFLNPAPLALTAPTTPLSISDPRFLLGNAQTDPTLTANKDPQELTDRAALLLADAASQPAPNADASDDDPSSSDTEALAKKLSNPVANLISVPFQYNADFGIGPRNVSRSTLNIQPVVPVSLNQNWNVIIRTILPVIYAESPADGVSSNWGLGDTTQSFFFSPTKTFHGWIIGAGPALLYPTATDTSLGTGKWGAGPTVVLLRQNHGFTYGILANHLWSFAGDDDRPSVNATFLQPFLSYTWPTATTLGINTESTYDWNASQWTVPINLFASQVIKIGKLPVSLTFGGRYYAEGPSGGPEWGLRFVFTFLFPK